MEKINDVVYKVYDVLLTLLAVIVGTIIAVPELLIDETVR